MSYFNSVYQSSNIDSNNSNSGTLGAGLLWNATGVGTDTAGFNAIQLVVSSDQNMTLYVEQGITNSSFQIDDFYAYNSTIGNFGITVKIVSPFVRVSIQNMGNSLANYSLNTTLVPMSESLPRSLDNLGNLKTGVYGLQDIHTNGVKVSPLGQMDVNQPYRLVGSSFGSSIDTNFWTATNNGTGSASGVASSLATIISGVGANGWGRFSSVRTGRFITDNVNKYRSMVRMLPSLTQINTNRYWGAFTATAGSAGVLPTSIDGYYFSLDGTSASLSVNTRNAGGTVNSVASGSFNGTISQFTMDNNVHTYEINYFPRKAQFLIDNVLVHSFIPTTALMSSTNDLPIMALSTNSVGGASTAGIEMWGASILRLGRDTTAPQSKFQLNTTTGVLCKTGGGNLISIAFSATAANAVINIYDGLTNAGTLMWSSGQISSSKIPYFIPFNNISFYTGLTLEITTQNTNTTLVYE